MATMSITVAELVTKIESLLRVQCFTEALHWAEVLVLRNVDDRAHQSCAYRLRGRAGFEAAAAKRGGLHQNASDTILSDAETACKIDESDPSNWDLCGDIYCALRNWKSARHARWKALKLQWSEKRHTMCACVPREPQTAEYEHALTRLVGVKLTVEQITLREPGVHVTVKVEVPDAGMACPLHLIRYSFLQQNQTAPGVILKDYNSQVSEWCHGSGLRDAINGV